MLKYGVVSDPCQVCRTDYKEFIPLKINEKAASDGYGHSTYANYQCCPGCQTVYTSYTGDLTSFGHPKRYVTDVKTTQSLLANKPYKFWLSVKKPTTEYGIYRKFGSSKLYNPLKGKIYSLIEMAFQLNKVSDIEKLESIYPKEVNDVRHFNV